MLYDEKSLKDALSNMMVEEVGHNEIYFNDEDGTFEVGWYDNSCESDDYYNHHHLVLTNDGACRDLSIWLGCFECGDCEATQEQMEQCYQENLEEEVDFDIIRDAVEDVAKSVLQEDMDLILTIIGKIYEYYYSINDFIQWCGTDAKYYELSGWDNIIDELENSNVRYEGKKSFNREWFRGSVIYINEILSNEINGLDTFRLYMEELRFKEALDELNQINKY